jgi:hypothetical protein
MLGGKSLGCIDFCIDVQIYSFVYMPSNWGFPIHFGDFSMPHALFLFMFGWYSTALRHVNDLFRPQTTMGFRYLAQFSASVTLRFMHASCCWRLGLGNRQLDLWVGLVTMTGRVFVRYRLLRLADRSILQNMWWFYIFALSHGRFSHRMPLSTLSRFGLPLKQSSFFPCSHLTSCHSVASRWFIDLWFLVHTMFSQ